MRSPTTPVYSPPGRLALLRHALAMYAYALWVAVRSIVRGPRMDGLKLLIAPTGYWRFWPNAFLRDAVHQLKRVSDVLDVSSPKLPSLYFAERTGARVVAIDYDDPAIFSRWLPTAQRLGIAGYDVGHQDARALQFPDAAFDFVYSISVIEHIPGDGDTQALREMARVVRPGGIVVVEVPFRHERQEVSRHYDSKGAPLDEPRFYERYYDEASLRERLVVDELELTDLRILSEGLPVDPWIAGPRLPRPVRLLILPVEPLLAMVNMRVGVDAARGRPLGAMLVYRKPATFAPDGGA